MKATVWTNYDVQSMPPVRPRCIFAGEIEHLPHAGDGIIVRDGFCVEKVRHVYYDLTDGTVEIGIEGSDPDQEYPDVDPT